MIGLRIDNKTNVPKYKQIKEQVKQYVATYQLKPGDMMPTRKELARSLHVTQMTIGHAFRELEQEGILGARRRRGTIVLANKEHKQTELHRDHLQNRMEKLIFEALSLSYSPDELESAFFSQLARWRLSQDQKQTESVVTPAVAAGFH